MRTRYTQEEIIDIRDCLAQYAHMPVAARRVIEQLMGDLEKYKVAIEKIIVAGDGISCGIALKALEEIK